MCPSPPARNSGSARPEAGVPRTVPVPSGPLAILRSPAFGAPGRGHLGAASLIEAVRDRVKTVDLTQVNAVLMQPHWRHDTTGEPVPPPAQTNQNRRTKP